jgi:ribosomal protein S18 acetylase RimI-like enzyme
VKIELRPATKDDKLFIESLYFEAHRWISEKLFGRRGDEFERAKFSQLYNAPNTAIVTVDGRRAGWLTVRRQPDAIHLDQIYLSAAWRNHGIGSSLIRQLMGAKINPASQLYERLVLE